MSSQFYDSSAFAKLFIDEDGTQAMLNLYRLAAFRSVSRIAFLEVGSAIRRRELSGDLQPDQVAKARSLLLAEMDRLLVVSVTDNVIALAQSIMDRQTLRSLDAIQLASALSVSADTSSFTFISSDSRLLHAAAGEGLLVADPLSI